MLSSLDVSSSTGDEMEHKMNIKGITDASFSDRGACSHNWSENSYRFTARQRRLSIACGG